MTAGEIEVEWQYIVPTLGVVWFFAVDCDDVVGCILAVGEGTAAFDVGQGHLEEFCIVKDALHSVADFEGHLEIACGVGEVGSKGLMMI